MNVLTKVLKRIFFSTKVKSKKGGAKMSNIIYDVSDVARYVINYINSKGNVISNLKLQKVLYFIQAAFLVEKGIPCFDEELEAWDFGPVVPSVYHAYKKFGAGYIPSINNYFQFSSDIFECRFVDYDNSIIYDEDKLLINNMVDQCINYSASQLVDITHHQSPWKNAYIPYSNNIITKESLYEFFKEGDETE